MPTQDEKPKEYRLVSIADILDVVTPENLENFLIDFKSYIQTSHALFGMAKLLDADSAKLKNSEIGESIFNWIDDGKHDATGGLRITDNETGKTTDLPLDLGHLQDIWNAVKNQSPS